MNEAYGNSYIDPPKSRLKSPGMVKTVEKLTKALLPELESRERTYLCKNEIPYKVRLPDLQNHCS
jgi:hypothetical protein